jgi:uncharacterized membrane protein
MSIKTYRVWTAIIMIIVAGLAGWGVATGNAFIPGPAVIVGAVILYFCRRRIKVVVEDERIHRIGDQASRRTIVIALITMAVVGSTLIALSTENRPELETVGVTLGYSVCAILVLYTILYNYFSRKFGGKE